MPLFTYNNVSSYVPGLGNEIEVGEGETLGNSSGVDSKNENNCIKLMLQ